MKETLEKYVKYFNEQRPFYAIGYDIPKVISKSCSIALLIPILSRGFLMKIDLRAFVKIMLVFLYALVYNRVKENKRELPVKE